MSELLKDVLMKLHMFLLHCELYGYAIVIKP